MTVSTIVPLVLMVKEYNNQQMELNELLIAISLLVLSVGLIFIFKLKTRIDEEGIHYQFFPFHFSLKTIKWSEIRKAYFRVYDPIGEYGGWGLKGGVFWKSSKGTAVNIAGDKGIQLELKNGKKLLIGTQKEAAVKEVLKRYFKDENE